jgi:sulfotransferase family protein
MIHPVPNVRKRPMEVLSLGFLRTGTASIQAALLTLGYDYTYHGLDIVDNWDDFKIWEKAADASFYGKGPELSKEDWDEMLGHCCATTDITSYFAEEMVSTYPEVGILPFMLIPYYCFSYN